MKLRIIRILGLLFFLLLTFLFLWHLHFTSNMLKNAIKVRKIDVPDLDSAYMNKIRIRVKNERVVRIQD